MYDAIMEVFKFLFVMLNQKLDFSFSLSRLFTIKIDVFPFFASFNSHSGLFPQKQ